MEAKLNCGTFITFFFCEWGLSVYSMALIVVVCVFEEHFPSDCCISQGHQKGKGDRDDDATMDPDPRLAASMEPKPLCFFQVTFAIFVVGFMLFVRLFN